MKQMEDGGKIAGYFLSYANNRVSLKTMVNHELKERTREEQRRCEKRGEDKMQ